MMLSVDNLMITSLETITAFTVGTDEYLFTLDELTEAKLTQSQESNDIVGARGAVLGKLKTTKKVTGSATNGLLSLPALAADVGGEVKRNQSVSFRWKDVCTVNSDAATLKYAPASSELFGVYKLNADNTLGARFEQVSTTPATGNVKVDNTALTFFEGDLQDGDRVVCYYDREISGATIVENESGKLSRDVHMVIDALAEDTSCNQYYVQIDIPKASLSGSSEIGGGDSQIMHGIEWEALASKCGGMVNKYWSYIVVDDGVIDA